MDISDTSRFTKSIAWLYHESGIASLYATGHDAWLVITARATRMFAFGGVSLIMALFFAELHFTDTQIGLFMTLTLAGDVALSFLLTMMADGLGRRKILFGGGLLMALSGLVFVFFENFWVLLLAAVIGVISATGGDFGPFRAIEESVLSHLTNPKTRSDVLSWYVTTSGIGSALGIELAGKFVHNLKTRKGWDDLRTYHAIFGVYVITGVANMIFAFALSERCEIVKTPTEAEDDGSQLAQGLLEDSDEEDDTEEDEEQQHDSTARRPARQTPASSTAAPAPASTQAKQSRFAHISAATRSIMYKLWFLLTVDSLADGMVSYTLTNYYMDRKLHLSKSALGDFMSINYILGSVSTVLAGPLARHLGLVNTMVFTHIPSSAAVLLFPLPQGVVMTVILLFIRGGLNNMDQAPRTAFIAAVVKPEERTAVMGITSMLRTLASTIGPTITGALAETDKFWIAFVAAGALRLAYDIGLWVMFVNMKLYSHEEDGAEETRDGHVTLKNRDSLDEEEGEFEMQPVDGQPQRAGES